MIIGAFPTTILNGQPEDATVVMSLFSWIQSQVNGNACNATTTTNVLKGDGNGNTTAAVLGTDYASPLSDYGLDSGSANTYVVNAGGPPASLIDGTRIRFKAASANTGASTLNVSSLGVQPIVNFYGNPLVGGEIIAHGNIEVTWNSSFNGGSGAWVIEATASLAPVGTVARWDTGTPPAGWLLRNGQAVSRAVYVALFALYGTTYGAGDGSTTFNLPNTVDHMPITAGNLYGNGATGGSKDAIVVAHTHTLTDPGHGHTYEGIQFTGNSNYPSTYGNYTPNSLQTNSATTGITVNSTGSSGTNANLPPYFANYEIVKA